MHGIQKCKRDQFMSNNTSVTGREAGSPLSVLVETPCIVRGDRVWLRHFSVQRSCQDATDYFTEYFGIWPI